MKHLVVLPTMVLAFKDNHQAAVTLSIGKFIEVIGPAADDDRFLVICTDEGQFHIFASDLSNRTRPVVAQETSLNLSEESPSTKPKPKKAAPRTRGAAA